MRPRSVVLAIALAASSAAGCTHAQRVKLETVAAKALVSDEEERALGAQVKRELARKITFVDDPAVTGWLARVVGPVVRAAEKARPGTEIQLHVVDDPKTVNAFAIPGGDLYVFSGLLGAARDASEVAGVLAHECGHIVARHAARQLVDQVGLETVASLALGENPSKIAEIGATILANGALLAYSRADETEADELGARLTSEAGYDPRALVSFLKTLGAHEGDAPGWAKFLSDHPMTPDRVAHLTEFIADEHLTGRPLGDDGLAEVKRRLGLGAAPR
jgi:predicted Zn-dependent protease